MNKEYNEEVRLQNLKEFVDEYANEEELTSVYGVRATIDIIEEQLNNYKKLLNANPSEALKNLDCLKLHINSRDMLGETNKKIALDICNDIEKALLKVQEPKQYLTWEDLEFNHTPKYIDVKMNDNKYKLVVGYNVAGKNLAILRDDKQQYFFLEYDKQFFNDLRLERVEE